MRDPSSWSFVIGRVFNITVRVHILFPLVAAGLIGRVAFTTNVVPGAWIDAAWLMALLFVLVFFHELGHCFAGRRVMGEANDILLWPLGGLAYVDVPHSPKAHLVTALGGPLVNVLFCLVCAGIMIFAFDTPFRPTWNPIWNPYRDVEGIVKLTTWSGAEVPVSVTQIGIISVARLFWISWLTLLLNLLPGFPLDGGRIFQSLLWPRYGYREATRYAIFSGFVVMMLFMIGSFIYNEVITLMLAFFIYISCKHEWIVLENGGEDSLFGYDFSQGYTSLERGEAQAAPPKRRRPNFFQRWLQRRAATRIQREQERQEADERRMDQLLEKIQRYGKESLTDEENRFLKRVADRYRNRP